MKKRQVTFSKMAREREVRERRARKLEKKHAAAAERKARAQGGVSPEDDASADWRDPATRTSP
jgi:hypothetical protein